MFVDVLHIFQFIKRSFLVAGFGCLLSPPCNLGSVEELEFEKIQSTFQVSTIASFLRMYIFPRKSRCAEDTGGGTFI